MERGYSTDSTTSMESFEFCDARRCSSCPLPFDPSSIEDLILNIGDRFNLRVVMGSDIGKGAMLLTTGLAMAGTAIGRHYGGKVGAAVGGAMGGACGLGIAAIAMRDVWAEIKPRLTELFDIVYDYLAGMGVEDYTKAATLVSQRNGNINQLAQVIMQVVSDVLGKRVLSSLSA